MSHTLCKQKKNKKKKLKRDKSETQWQGIGQKSTWLVDPLKND